MPAKVPAALLIGLVAALAGLFIFLSKGDLTEERTISRKERDPNTSHPTAAAEPNEEALPSKSAPRSPTPEISKAKTLALLQTPIPGTVAFPQQTLAERVAAINQLLAQAGIPLDQLSIAVEARTAETPFALDGVFESLTLQDPTPATILKYTTGSMRLRYRIGAGLVEFIDGSFTDPLPDVPDGDDPFFSPNSID